MPECMRVEHCIGTSMQCRREGGVGRDQRRADDVFDDAPGSARRSKIVGAAMNARVADRVGRLEVVANAEFSVTEGPIERSSARQRSAWPPLSVRCDRRHAAHQRVLVALCRAGNVETITLRDVTRIP